MNFEILEECDNWIEAEQFWISYLKTLGCNLRNIAPGGYAVSELSKKKMSEKRKGEKHPRFGKIVSKDQRNKQSNSHKGNLAGEKHFFYGKPCSEERRLKIAKSLSTRYTDDQIRAIRKDPRKQEEIAKEYGTVISIISRIKNNKIWRHVS